MSSSLKLFKQLGIVLLITFAGECISRFPGIPVPGSIVGMILLLVLLKLKILREERNPDYCTDTSKRKTGD